MSWTSDDRAGSAESTIVMAELNVRHTRRHQPTRRVALDPGYLPTNGNAYGAVLLGAVVAEHVDGLDEEQQELLPRFLRDVRRGDLGVPRIALRYRLQTDVHGLDRSRHRFLAEPGRVIVELDVHGHPAPQVIGALMAAAAMGSSARAVAFRAVDAALARPGMLPEGVVIRRLAYGVPGSTPFPPGANGTGRRFEPDFLDQWRSIPSEQRWAMEVLGVRAGVEIDRVDVQRRFRRLLRLAHPDQGAASAGAAERIAELSEARELLIASLVSSEEAAPA